jgi:hypothetical protein
MDKYADLTRPSATMLARGINLAHHNPGSRRSNPLLLQHTLDSTHDFEVLRGGALGTHQRFRRRYDLSGSIDDAEPPGAAPSRPCQETPADLGTPSKFVGRTSLIARRGSARPPMFFYSGVEQLSSDHLPRRPRRKPTSATENRLSSARLTMKGSSRNCVQRKDLSPSPAQIFR